MKQCVINFAEGSWYPKGQHRLGESLKSVGFTGDYIQWSSSGQLGCPTHSQVPYAFKTWALMNARAKGYDQAFFADASLYAVRSLEPLFAHITFNGYLFEEAGHWTGTWCKDAALATLEVTRDEAMKIPMLSAGAVGFDFNNGRANTFLERWHALAQDGITFPGPWNNANNNASNDSRVEGHRHDMTAASVLAYKLGMPLVSGGTFLAYVGGCYGTPKSSTCFHLSPA